MRVAYGHSDVWIRGYVGEVVIDCRGEIIARHPRCYKRFWRLGSHSGMKGRETHLRHRDTSSHRKPKASDPCGKVR